jgi:hypothetical protein
VKMPMFCGSDFNINVSGDVKEFTLNPAARCGWSHFRLKKSMPSSGSTHTAQLLRAMLKRIKRYRR